MEECDIWGKCGIGRHAKFYLRIGREWENEKIMEEKEYINT